MDAHERKVKFTRLKEYFDRLDMQLIEKKGLSVFATSYGIYGSSSLFDVFELFERMRLHERARLVDLGSGDGRVALLAALFTSSAGMEGDEELHALASKAKEDLLEHIPELARCDLSRTDYMGESLASFDTLFIYADHNWPESFQRKLLEECRAVLVSQHNIFRPDRLRKGRTYWVEQIPFVTYHLNVEEEALGKDEEEKKG